MLRKTKQWFRALREEILYGENNLIVFSNIPSKLRNELIKNDRK
jgi:hypothetical protein